MNPKVNINVLENALVDYTQFYSTLNLRFLWLQPQLLYCNVHTSQFLAGVRAATLSIVRVRGISDYSTLKIIIKTCSIAYINYCREKIKNNEDIQFSIIVFKFIYTFLYPFVKPF